MKVLEVELEQLRLLVVAVVGREHVGCASGSGGGTVDKVGEDDKRDARDSSPQPGRRLRGGKVVVVGRQDGRRRDVGRQDERRRERKKWEGRQIDRRKWEWGRGDSSKGVGGEEMIVRAMGVREMGGKVSGGKATGTQVS